MPVKAVFFDLDGTLADYESSVEAAFDEAYALVTRYHPQLQKRDFRSKFDATLRISVEAEMRGLPQYVSRRDRFREPLRRPGGPDHPQPPRTRPQHRILARAPEPGIALPPRSLGWASYSELVKNGQSGVA